MEANRRLHTRSPDNLVADERPAESCHNSGDDGDCIIFA
jgi:hypothetical protein